MEWCVSVARCRPRRRFTALPSGAGRGDRIVPM
ncbi:hypothetical protein Ae168Ps1_3344c [Pseudonocardia sp. Ae168_Ps1]|nr:hypothetical protein Ae150APs1_3324c [Pseudonocardia sp. Ae150A_Ps1]OLL80938.1 hypothetical protein Ae168Ps1_3344c [Pseudonocardia sp. Ae168_Ps1]OLL95039.1 hypothetical protein Ae356Ps1_4936c [Pseudonocardia sp. Ae356_Ps1]